VTIPNSVTNISDQAFANCPGLSEIYFTGNAPYITGDVFFRSSTTVFYLPGTTNWGTTFGGRPTVLWNPQIKKDAHFGECTNGFGFTICGNTNLTIVTEACTNLLNSEWSSLSTNILTDGTSYFNDSDWTNYPARFYRFCTPK
jgi:hypothetical protein